MEKLNRDSKNFDAEYNQIVFGGMLVELAIENDKYAFEKNLKLPELYDLAESCNIQTFPQPLAFWQPEDLIKNENCINLIKGVGKLIVERSMDFTETHLDCYFNRSLQYLSHYHNSNNKEPHHEHMTKFNNLTRERHKEVFSPSLKCSR